MRIIISRVFLSTLTCIPTSVLRPNTAFAEKTNKVLSVCDVIAKLPEYNAEILIVRGKVLRGEHGSWLVPEENKCPTPLITEGYTWPNSIHLVREIGAQVEADPRQERPRNQSSNGEGESDSVVIGTYIGILETRDPPVVVHYPNGSVTGYGFGHLDWAPAELTFTVVKDKVLLKQKPLPRKSK